jgi:hypothetical protein
MKGWRMAGVAVFAVVSAACTGGSSTGGLDAERTYQFGMSASEEVPPPKPSGAAGAVQLIVYPDRIDYDVAASITGVTTAHIHNGAPGATGPIVATLFQIGTPTGQVGGTFARGSLTDATLSPTITLAALKTLLASGNAYVDVHTATNPLGEIRGQVK